MQKLTVVLVCLGYAGDGRRVQNSRRRYWNRHLTEDGLALAASPLSPAAAFDLSTIGAPFPNGKRALKYGSKYPAFRTTHDFDSFGPRHYNSHPGRFGRQIYHASTVRMSDEAQESQLGIDMDVSGSKAVDGAGVADEMSAMSFYNISPVADPGQSVEEHRTFLSNYFITGRVYICSDGINAQVSGPAADIAAYERFVSAEFPSDTIIFQKELVPEHAFPKLKVKHKALVPSGEDLSLRGTHLSPKEWRDRLAKAKSKPLKLLDVRNSYEWEIGRFRGADRPAVEQFKNTSCEALGLDKQDKDQDILMYCTGGIRCEYYSARLKREGYKNVYQLEGGIQNYGKTVGSEGWDGKLFVFDRRNTVPVGDGKTDVVGRCKHCGKPADTVHNCCNVDCNLMHVACDACWEKHTGLCAPECQHGDRIRPWIFYEDGRPVKGLSFEQGPPPGHEDINKGKHLQANAPRVIAGVTPKQDAWEN